MNRANNKLLSENICALALLVTVTGVWAPLWAAEPPERVKPTQPKQQQPKQPPYQLFGLKGDKITLLSLKEWINGKFKSGYPKLERKDQIPTAIRNRGVTFEADENTIRELESIGAAPDVIAALREVSPVKVVKQAPPPPPPPKPVKAPLTIRCVPAECGVRIDVNSVEETNNGVLRKELELGRYTIVVIKSGYATEQQAVTLTTAGHELSFKLKPMPDTMARFGSELAKKMLAAHAIEPVELLGTGAWSKTTTQGSEERTFAIRSGPKEYIMLLVSQPGWYQLGCAGETCSERNDKIKDFNSVRQGNKLKGDEARRVDQELRAFRKALLPYVMNEIRPAIESFRLHATAETDAAGPDGHYKLTVEGGDEKYLIDLNPVFLITEVTHIVGPIRSSVTYGQYEDIGRGKHPKLIRYQSANDKDGVLQVRLDTLTVAPGK